MKVLTLFGAVIFATGVVAGSAQANGQDKNRAEKKQVRASSLPTREYIADRDGMWIGVNASPVR
ncbi:hypothetical protein N7463_003929 [Penicillium fimorum]|uniref:Uncharacterized protein n=1 Tax=Penicillium fimorum TaxID=1882269 RepID=A0A9W9Y1Z9_9EURO|nr:hypothetical protein N7463_003929 [Penicillium fimorum]